MVGAPEAGGAARDDGEIRREIEGALAADAGLEAGDIEVQVDGGVATLRGTVPSDRAQRRVEEVARAVRGVREVRNELIAAT